MDRTKLIHSVPLVAFLMALALIGWPVIEFIFTAIATIIVAAVLLYAVLGLFSAIDRVINYLYTAR